MDKSKVPRFWPILYFLLLDSFSCLSFFVGCFAAGRIVKTLAEVA